MTANQKTYKREVACAMLVFLAGLFIAAAFKPSLFQLAEYLTTPVFMFAFAAFGFDAYVKQKR